MTTQNIIKEYLNLCVWWFIVYIQVLDAFTIFLRGQGDIIILSLLFHVTRPWLWLVGADMITFVFQVWLYCRVISQRPKGFCTDKVSLCHSMDFYDRRQHFTNMLALFPNTYLRRIYCATVHQASLTLR